MVLHFFIWGSRKLDADHGGILAGERVCAGPPKASWLAGELTLTVLRHQSRLTMFKHSNEIGEQANLFHDYIIYNVGYIDHH